LKTKSAAAIFLALTLFLPVAALAERQHVTEKGKYTQHFDDSVFAVTDKGEFSVEMLWGGKKLDVGKNSFDIVIHSKADMDVEGAGITIEPVMPAHGMKAERPSISDRGGGLYRVKKLVLQMPGLWQLKVTIKKDAVEDSAVVDLPEVSPEVQ
jgi:hypothetical protein